MKFYFFVALGGVLTFGGAYPAQARPVSYAGGTTVTTAHDGHFNSLHMHYSPTVQYSIGLKTEYWREGEYVIQAVQMNNLLKRWNNPGSQGNLYLKSGVGIAIGQGETAPAFYTGVAADWEDRRYFVSYENRYTHAGDVDTAFMQSARIGVAPYVGEYGDIHTWAMLQVDHAPESIDKITVTPLVRVFKDVHLIEAGMSHTGKVLFNWTVRF